MHFIRVNNDVRGQKGDVSNSTFAQGEAKLSSKDLKKAQNDAQVAAEAAIQEKLLKTGDSKKQRDGGILTPISFRKMYLAKLLLARLKMAAPSVFPTVPLVFIVSINQLTLLTVRVEILIRRGGKIYQMSVHFSSVFGNLAEAPNQPSVISVEPPH